MKTPQQLKRLKKRMDLAFLRMMIISTPQAGMLDDGFIRNKKQYVKCHSKTSFNRIVQAYYDRLNR